VDQFGKLSILGVWRHVAVPQFPAVHPRAHLVMQLRGRRTELGTHEFAVRLLDPEGRTVLEQGGTVQVNEPPAGVVDLEAPAIFVFDLPLPMAGEYALVVQLDGEESARVGFRAGRAG
jgi:hypothetical protein